MGYPRLELERPLKGLGQEMGRSEYHNIMVDMLPKVSRDEHIPASGQDIPIRGDDDTSSWPRTTMMDNGAARDGAVSSGYPTDIMPSPRRLPW
ncbi:hypothetical protein CLAFUW4_04199 [Fulvia fulva]|uniref:Uncharacterized protein n=1 Tax=Passalora fulva TaxID=5499 RepID=A0A9Q8LG51_PASFU|nr:uncharacterized protein CLAFUR5_04162 [Fulvia fulva]KAK4626604.1 hypothetical protein CLAFUR4_04185 [Fulvia fulva]KAK4627417.1 hypothetical protein CLAFUR0_04185 [Fulvia fulva]UJO16819.1 hypothetical protein CLAFUR5_04162 [Fulvia fulva]WPV14253.1 hypothetical protein CLAFUW4_04199 [Fulvia fulva]WPV28391.1 hypothetical protein CLAFUW7_04188 [Fulvia fulva]